MPMVRHRSFTLVMRQRAGSLLKLRVSLEWGSSTECTETTERAGKGGLLRDGTSLRAPTPAPRPKAHFLFVAVGLRLVRPTPARGRAVSVVSSRFRPFRAFRCSFDGTCRGGRCPFLSLNSWLVKLTHCPFPDAGRAAMPTTRIASWPININSKSIDRGRARTSADERGRARTSADERGRARRTATAGLW